MSWDLFAWVLVASSLIGNVFIIRKNVIGQWMWAAGNLGWVMYNLTIGAHAQAFLFAVYFAMCVWGIISWTKEKNVTSKPQVA